MGGMFDGFDEALLIIAAIVVIISVGIGIGVGVALQ